MTSLYIGIMSGTSLDGIDTAIIDTDSSPPRFIAAQTCKIPPTLHEELTTLCTPGNNEIERMGLADCELATAYAEAVNVLLDQQGLSSNEILAIGNHGQTIRHCPTASTPFTVQIGDPNTLAELTGITVVSDFRRRDMATNGQGAPLAPAFHTALFSDPKRYRAIVNIGGIANITLLPPSAPCKGYDTGPGNTLMDYWANKHLQQAYDHDGAWAASGQINQPLLNRLLEEPFFTAPPPKSTGKELFSATWLHAHLNDIENIPEADVQATLAQLSASSIAQALQTAPVDELYVCGGGSHNSALIGLLKQALPSLSVGFTDALGIPVDFVEACGFAWLAAQTISKTAIDTRSFTGASNARILGGIYYA